MHQIIYISNPERQHIYVWKLNDIKKKLKLIQTLHTPGNAQPIAIHPNQKFLYVGIRPHFSIITYHIDQNGLLNAIKITKLLNSPTYLTINMTGTLLYCISYNYNSINVIEINRTGIPDRIVQIIKQLPGCHSANIDTTQRLLWIPCLQEHSIRLFNINKIYGTLTAHSPDRISMNTDSGPRHMDFHKITNHSYVINELNGTISVIKYKSKTIKPTIIQTIQIVPNKQNVKQFWAADIHITPDNRWLYCSDRFLNIISCFKICSQTQKLQFMYTQHTEKQPRGFAIDITGNFLIVAGQKSCYIALYKINPSTGKLNLLSRYSSGIGSMWISINPCHAII